MYCVCVTCVVKPGMGDAYVEVCRKNHEGSIKEPGCLRWDFLRQATPPQDGEPEVFFLYEVYYTEDDFKAHQQTPHFFQFKADAEALQLEPRKGQRFVSVLPDPWR
jgi:(4S)-4-hydroxy-5-phosphonooxypentane-2,3-dione isomerase